MPCLLKTLHSTTYYTSSSSPMRLHARSAAEAAASAVAGKTNPGIVADSAHDAAALALLIAFFALLGTAVVLGAVYFSKRALERECRQANTVKLQVLPSSSGRDEDDGKGSMAMAESSRTSSLRSSESKVGNVELPRLQAERAQFSDGKRGTIRDRRGMPKLVCPKVRKREGEMPRLPPPAHRSEPKAVFPGARLYGMGQMVNDGRVHRPESIFEYVRP